MAIKTKNTIYSYLKILNILLNFIKDLKVIKPKKIALPTFYKYNFLNLNKKEKGFIYIVYNRYTYKNYKVFKKYFNIIYNIKSKSKSFNNIDFKLYYKKNYPIKTFF